MRTFISALFLAGAATALGVFVPTTGAQATPAMLGFTPAGTRAQRALEAKFDAALNAPEIGHWIETLASGPNQLGSPHDKANAEHVLKLFKSWGFDAKIETYYVLFPTPKTRELTLVSPTHYQAKLTEPPVKGDKTSYIRKGTLPPFNAYSADGDVTAPLVYVNYGLPADYKVLARHGISVKGRIVIVRYGHSWRGIKPRLAYEHGAIGCIIYSDPYDDGYRRGNTYPEGGWRDQWGAQRGSVMNMTIHPGGPLTPGYAATKNAKRLPISKSRVIKKIPVLPIAWADAKPLLAAIGGPVAPSGWQGALPFTYHIGPGPAKVHLKLAFNWNTVPAYDVIAKIPGTEYPNQWVMRGNHRDAWVFGAQDPEAGQASLLAEAKALGALLKTGWRPKRTIVYMSWDGEEEGLLGSTEWAEGHAKQLAHGGAIYINSDTNGRGFLFVGGSGSLQRFLDQVGKSVTDPETGVNVIARDRDRGLVHQLNHPPEMPAMKLSASATAPFPLGALGSGSDYSAFLDHFGVATLNLGFGGESEGTQYHSRYDSWYWYSHFGDPGFQYGVALSEVAGHAVLRYADASVLPLSFEGFAKHVGDYAQEIEKLHKKMQKQTQQKDALIEHHDFKIASDPAKTYVPPKSKAAVPAIDFGPLDQAVARLKKAAAAYDTAFAKHANGLSKSARNKLNTQLLTVTRAALYKPGLPNRGWYKNMIYAPGYYTGYGVKTLPGIREAVEHRQWDTAKKYIGIVAHTLNDYSARIERATATLKGGNAT
ncbi:MAG: transferrin receptor-like dimerization domain-containing protein [Gammaproteobacteria bacterium]